MPTITVNVGTVTVGVNSQDVDAAVNFAAVNAAVSSPVIETTVNDTSIVCDVVNDPVNVTVNCCGDGLLSVPPDGNLGEVLTKTGAGATDYAWQPAGAFSVYAMAVTVEAGEDISATRLVKIVSGVATLYQPATDLEAAGIARTSALSGNTLTVILSGRVTIAGWGLTPGAVYWAGANGQIFSTDPETTRSKQVGAADSSNTLILNIKETLLLN